jgi:hypothetical protein
MAAGDAGTSENRPYRYLDDISEDELSANAPPDVTTDDKNARRDRNRKQNERRRCLREALPIWNLNEALDQVANWIHTTLEQCLMSITTIAHQAQGIHASEVITKLAEDAYFMRVDNRVSQVPPIRTHEARHHEATSRSPADGGRNVSVENTSQTPTALGTQLEDPLRVALVVATAVLEVVTTTTMVVAAAAEAHPMVPTEELVVAAIAEAKAMQIATSPATHVAAMTPAIGSMRSIAKRLLKQTTATTSPPTPHDFTTCSFPRSSNLS